MNTARYEQFWLWLAYQPNRSRWGFRVLLASQIVWLAAFMLAPHAAAAGVDGLLGFTGINDSHHIPLTANMYVRADDTLFDWNGVLPRINTGVSVSDGIAASVGAWITSFIVVSVSLMLWLIKVLRSAFWNDLIGAIFKIVGFSLEQVVNAGPFVPLGLLIGSFVGVMMMAVGRHTAGRMAIAVTWALGIIGYSIGTDAVSKVLAPSGWLNQVRTVADGIAGTLMRQGRLISSGDTGIDRKFDELQTGFADATRQGLQQWMLGRIVDGQPADQIRAGVRSDALCSLAWDRGQESGNAKTLLTYVVKACPADVQTHLSNISQFEGLFLFALLMACLFVGAKYAWNGLNCLFRAAGIAAFALAILVYALFDGFPRRFGKLVASDFVKQVLSYGVWIVMTGLYVLVLMTCFQLKTGNPLANSLVGRLMVTAIIMVMLTTLLRHLGKLHEIAMRQPSAPNVSPGKLAAPIAGAVGAAAAMGVSGAMAARGGGGRPVNNSSTAARLNAGMGAAQRALSFAHPGASAVGAIAGGFGGAGLSSFQSRRGGDGGASTGPGGAGGSRRPAGRSDSGNSGPGRGDDAASRASERAQRVREDAAALARSTALRRPGEISSTSRPAGTAGGGSGFVSR
ncbi:hypothetical protein [Mycobacteroides abscessus]|uniref:hypothetical protein n=1 Tax=Mycobacteroides abscessus TaxID=36809 RepID=UPI0009A70EFC|nr:hypothetical protein [Mycobacteroides abscessus]SKH87792.1 Uncharacterised protein [Mycobacteroides abscessus subsp. massiliense]SKH91901.1 Uncharacterised protein [Mycobacteroides abscessus subsp. massiliense]SKI12544.1 Uncharacterised protein [Mycobacteroides abscessus subsp. massiliense]SKK22031.1 Uncharacterised protein [Mycobacteroides abscessus subsp. massiliense]SKK31161.1 Uncharacterised protein [Mycobacteroides abscessus subsp. massiliense]